MKYYKITNKEEKHYNQQYHDGLNVCCQDWNPSGDCQDGGMYFTNASNILDFVGYGCWIREVELLPDSRIYENPGTPKKWKTDKFILHERRYWCTVEVLEELRQQGASMNGRGVLCEASRYGRLDIVKYLVKHGCNLDNYDALCEASENGLDIVKYLVEHGCNPDDSNALCRASENGHLDIVKYLVENGCDLDNYDALWKASENGHLDIVMYLVECGCNPDNYDALWWASYNGHLDIVKYLEGKINMNLLIEYEG